MAGQKLVLGETVSDGRFCGGLPQVTIVENGNIQRDDKWALFRLSDDGLMFWHAGPDFRAEIMTLEVGGKRVVKELSPRYQTEEEAETARVKLPHLERSRTLIRSVRPNAY